MTYYKQRLLSKVNNPLFPGHGRQKTGGDIFKVLKEKRIIIENSIFSKNYSLKTKEKSSHLR